MSSICTWHGLSFEEERHLVGQWETQGLDLRLARALVWAGILTINDLNNTPDHELTAIQGVGESGLLKIHALAVRKASV